MFKKIINKMRIIIKITANKIAYKERLSLGNDFAFRKRLEINITGKDAKISIGSNVFFNNDCSLNSKIGISIGDDCIFGEGVKIYDHNHEYKDFEAPIYKQGYKIRCVTIGRGCWIGSNSIILPGSSIGERTIIGAGCIINGDIPSGVIVTSGRKITIKDRIR